MGNKANNLRVMRSILNLPIPAFITNHEAIGLWGEEPTSKLDYEIGPKFEDLDTLYEKVRHHFYIKNYDGDISIRSSGRQSMPGILKTALFVDLQDKESFKLYYQSVLNSFSPPLAKAYRKRYNLPDEEYPTIIFQQMVSGLGENSCSGIYFTKDPKTGLGFIEDEVTPSIRFLNNSSGEKIVNGSNSLNGVEFQKQYPEQFKQLVEIGQILEENFFFPQDIEFTIDNGKLYILQSRDVVFDKKILLSVYSDLIKKGWVTKEQVRVKVTKPEKRDYEFVSQGNVVAFGEGVSSGIGTGILSENSLPVPFILYSEQLELGEDVNYTNCVGIVSKIGNKLCHAAIQARKYGIPCIICNDIKKEVYFNDIVTLDGSSGYIYYGDIKTDVSSYWNDVEYIFGSENNF